MPAAPSAERTADPLRIAIVTETWLPAIDGVVTRLNHTVTELAGRGHEVLVLAATLGDPRPGVRQQRLPSTRFTAIDRTRRWALPSPRLVRSLDRFGADVVHLVNPVLMGSVAAGAVAGRRPLVASLHTDVAEYAARYRLGLLRPPLRRLTTTAYGRADVRLATSPTGVDLIGDLGAGPATVWPAAVDEPFLTATGGRTRSAGPQTHVVCVGRLAREKQYERLLPALQHAAGEHATPGRGLRLTFVGDGPDRGRLQRLFAGLPVHFAGALRGPELVSAYRAADVLAFTSTTDTVGLVLLEAAALGMPVVAADARATRDTLAGYPRLELVPPGGDAASWVAALHRAADSPAPPTAWAGSASWRSATDVLLRAYEQARSTWLRRGRPLVADRTVLAGH